MGDGVWKRLQSRKGNRKPQLIEISFLYLSPKGQNVPVPHGHPITHYIFSGISIPNSPAPIFNTCPTKLVK